MITMLIFFFFIMFLLSLTVVTGVLAFIFSAGWYIIISCFVLLFLDFGFFYILFLGARSKPNKKEKEKKEKTNKK